MAREFSRTYRVGQLVKRELAQIIQQELSDPRIGMVTVSHVDVTPDMKYAKVFVTMLGRDETEDDINACLQGLRHAAGFLRRHLADRIELRYIPELRFHYDKTLENGFHMDALIARATRDLSED